MASRWPATTKPSTLVMLSPSASRLLNRTGSRSAPVCGVPASRRRPGRADTSSSGAIASSPHRRPAQYLAGSPVPRRGRISPPARCASPHRAAWPGWRDRRTVRRSSGPATAALPTAATATASAWSAACRRKLEPPINTRAPMLFGASRIGRPVAGAATDGLAAAWGAGRPLTIAWSVSANAARLLGSLSTSSTCAACAGVMAGVAVGAGVAPGVGAGVGAGVGSVAAARTGPIARPSTISISRRKHPNHAGSSEGGGCAARQGNARSRLKSGTA